MHRADFWRKMDMRFKRGSRERSTGRRWGAEVTEVVGMEDTEKKGCKCSDG